MSVDIPEWVRAEGPATCRCCEESLTNDFLKNEEASVKAMSHSARVEWDRLRKLSHDGKAWRRPKFLMVDHKKMHLTQLHHLLEADEIRMMRMRSG